MKALQVWFRVGCQVLNRSQWFVMPAPHLFSAYRIDFLCVWLVVNEPQLKVKTSNEAY